MDENQWLSWEDPGELIDELNQRGAASRRKFRLFSCACARLVWHLLPDVARTAVEVAERNADGLASDEERQAAQELAKDVGRQYPKSDPRAQASFAAVFASWADVRQNHGSAEGAGYVVMNVHETRALEARVKTENAYAAVVSETNRLQCRLYRDVMGNPFRPVSIDPSWLVWNGHTVVSIAEGIYDDRAFDRLPILADSLEDAGCTDEDILGHCRQPGDHVRGCWVVDLLLGKE